MYLSDGAMASIADEIVEYFLEGNMVSFAKQSVELYKKYDEFTADDIMLLVKRKIIELSSDAKSMIQVVEEEIGQKKYNEGYEEAKKELKADILTVFQETSPSVAKLSRIRGILSIPYQDEE